MSNVTALRSEAHSPSGSMALLQLAARDNSLAAELEKNPKAAFEKLGILLSEQDIPGTVSLPSTDAMRRAAMQCSFNEENRYFGFFGGMGGD